MHYIYCCKNINQKKCCYYEFEISEYNILILTINFEYYTFTDAMLEYI